MVRQLFWLVGRISREVIAVVRGVKEVRMNRKRTAETECFRGMHACFGTYFAEYLTDTWGPYSIKEAWRRASQDDPHQTSNEVAAIYAVCVHYFPWTYKHYWNEYLPGYEGGMFSDPPTRTSRMVRAIYLEYSSWSC